MICPYCDLDASPRALHAHFADAHPEKIEVTQTATERSYDVVCPICGDGYSQPIKPRLFDPAFLEEFDREIRLVAFDMLLNHLLAEHTETESGGADDPRP